MREIFKTQYSLTSKVIRSVEGFFDVSWCKEGYHVPEFGLLINGSKGKIVVDDDVVRVGARFWAINPMA